MDSDIFSQHRQRMVADQIARRGVRDPATLGAMLKVPREKFVLQSMMSAAYEDSPLPIGEGQTISQPYIVALMIQAAELEPSSVCLEIGTGSGYSAAVIGQIASQVYTVERIKPLAEQAKKRLQDLNYNNIEVKIDDGTLGWHEHAPYDVIIVTAGAPVVPESLIFQLKVGGRLIIPVGDASTQNLLRIRKREDGSHSQEILEYVRFVPLIGKEGW